MAELTVQITDELYQRLLQQIEAEGTSLDQLVERMLAAQLAAEVAGPGVAPSASWEEWPMLDHLPTAEAAEPLGDHDLLPGMFDALTAVGAIWELDSPAEETMIDKGSLVATPSGEQSTSFAVAKDITTALQTIAQQQGVSTQTLINLWLQEKLWQMNR